MRTASVFPLVMRLMQLGTTTSRLHFCTGSTVHRSPSPHPTSGNATSFPRFPICRGVSLHRLAVLRDAKGVFTSSLSRELSCMILRAVAGVRSRMHVHNTLFQRPDACQSSPCVRALCMAELRRHMSPCGGGVYMMCTPARAGGVRLYLWRSLGVRTQNAKHPCIISTALLGRRHATLLRAQCVVYHFSGFDLLHSSPACA